MKNDFIDAPDEPVGTCMQNGGMSECTKWPELVPAPCCWLSCNELCGAACWKVNKKYGEKCEYYGGVNYASSSVSQHVEHRQRRMASA